MLIVSGNSRGCGYSSRRGGGAVAYGCKGMVGPPHLLLRERVVLLELLRCAAVRPKRKERKERS